MTRDDFVRALREALVGRELRLAVLFGSGARDALRDDSDLDVGILPRNPAMALSEELALQASLERAAKRAVDLVRLDRASIVLRWRVAREGIVLVADPANEWPRFVARVGIEHGDFAPLYARTAEQFRRRLAAGTSGR
jgi:predicted nucleotidyltransferase